MKLYWYNVSHKPSHSNRIFNDGIIEFPEIIDAEDYNNFRGAIAHDLHISYKNLLTIHNFKELK